MMILKPYNNNHFSSMALKYNVDMVKIEMVQ